MLMTRVARGNADLHKMGTVILDSIDVAGKAMKKTGKRRAATKGRIKVAKSSYSPTKAETEELVKIPKKLEGASFDAFVSVAIRPVEVEESDKPK